MKTSWTLPTSNWCTLTTLKKLSTSTISMIKSTTSIRSKSKTPSTECSASRMCKTVSDGFTKQREKVHQKIIMSPVTKIVMSIWLIMHTASLTQKKTCNMLNMALIKTLDQGTLYGETILIGSNTTFIQEAKNFKGKMATFTRS
jgi:hypothetical protein